MDLFDVDSHLPEDWREGIFAGRIDRADGPTPVLVRNGHLFDMSCLAPTSADLREVEPRSVKGDDLGAMESIELSGAPDADMRLHKLVDTVAVSSSRLGTLINDVTTSKAAAPWTFWMRAHMRNLAERGLNKPC